MDIITRKVIEDRKKIKKHVLDAKSPKLKEEDIKRICGQRQRSEKQGKEQ